MKLLPLTTPTLLTLTRLIISPAILPTLLVWFLPRHSALFDGALAVLFIILGITDFFDGYIARRWGQESLLGKFLDPLADKFLVFSTLIALVATQRISYATAIIMIGREFFVMGLREFALLNHVSVPVMWEGKVKTALQLVYLALVIVGVRQRYGSYGRIVEQSALGLALGATVYSAVVYYWYCMQQM